ncbi:hypothetical protein CY34DRAFT_325679 [Suillus luteus UH-Slu-Lm8-n1]|uniref:Uncharacterized protein n=1 Tax=Suillus luteus UH-Slu-Lm8-n1 TaxID=930992 RepID=A0A0D0AD25_9AGAM|nr:hypothetical protein CY34DRAFT_325679 [Suillus luteus UH-Slu-Lm8-n1]
MMFHISDSHCCGRISTCPSHGIVDLLTQLDINTSDSFCQSDSPGFFCHTTTSAPEFLRQSMQI